MIKRLPKAILENAFIRATRDDDGYGLAGTLCRGEFFETILRVAHGISLKKKDKTCVGEVSELFVQQYMQPVYDASKIVNHRKKMRGSKRLN